MARLLTLAPVEGPPVTLGAATLSARDLGPLTSIAPFRGRDGEVAARLGVPLPKANAIAAWGEGRLLSAGPGRWLLAGAPPPDGLEALAAVVDLSDSVAAVALDGPAARDVLARLVPLDLRDRTCPEGSTARTLLNHMTVTLTRIAPESWELMAMRSMAGTLVHELTQAMRAVAARG